MAELSVYTVCAAPSTEVFISLIKLKTADKVNGLLANQFSGSSKGKGMLASQRNKRAQTKRTYHHGCNYEG